MSDTGDGGRGLGDATQAGYGAVDEAQASLLHLRHRRQLQQQVPDYVPQGLADEFIGLYRESQATIAAAAPSDASKKPWFERLSECCGDSFHKAAVLAKKIALHVGVTGLGAHHFARAVFFEQDHQHSYLGYFNNLIWIMAVKELVEYNITGHKMHRNAVDAVKILAKDRDNRAQILAIAEQMEQSAPGQFALRAKHHYGKDFIQHGGLLIELLNTTVSGLKKGAALAFAVQTICAIAASLFDKEVPELIDDSGSIRKEFMIIFVVFMACAGLEKLMKRTNPETLYADSVKQALNIHRASPEEVTEIIANIKEVKKLSKEILSLLEQLNEQQAALAELQAAPVADEEEAAPDEETRQVIAEIQSVTEELADRVHEKTAKRDRCLHHAEHIIQRAQQQRAPRAGGP